MLKRDPYGHEARWEKWKQENSTAIKGISEHNSELILAFLRDMEMGKNVAPGSRKGERSPGRLITLKSQMVFFSEHLGNNDLDTVSKDEVHQLFFDMRKGKILRKNGKSYLAIEDFVRDFKAFWGWLLRTGKAKENITVDLRRRDGRKPDWVYLTEEQFKTLANYANADYRALIWFMYDTGARVTEAYSIRVKDFSNDFTRLNIRREYSKTFGRIINLKICSGLIKGYIQIHNLQPQDFLFIKKPAAFNKYLRTTAGRIFGDKESPAREPYNKMTLYDIRHNACCYWLRRYPTTTALMYRMGWSEEKEVRYYSEFLGQADQISDDDMVTLEDKSKYEKRILALERDREKANKLIKKLIEKIS